MNYALIENGMVTNIIWLYPGNAQEFPDAVPMGDVPVRIGDAYRDGSFYREGEQVLSSLEKAERILDHLTGGVNDVQYE